MKFSAITQDQILMIDGVAVLPPHVNFEMPRGEWAVHFDDSIGVGEVEYLDSRPNETITQSNFDERYAHLVGVHGLAVVAMKEAAQVAENV